MSRISQLADELRGQYPQVEAYLKSFDRVPNNEEKNRFYELERSHKQLTAWANEWEMSRNRESAAMQAVWDGSLQDLREVIRGDNRLFLSVQETFRLFLNGNRTVVAGVPEDVKMSRLWMAGKPQTA